MCGPTTATSASAANASSTARAEPGVIHVSGLHTRTTGARVAAMPRLAARAYPRLACGSITGTPLPEVGDRAVGRAVVDHDDLDRSGGVVGAQCLDALGDQRARLVVHDHRGPARRVGHRTK